MIREYAEIGKLSILLFFNLTNRLLSPIILWMLGFLPNISLSKVVPLWLQPVINMGGFIVMRLGVSIIDFFITIASQKGNFDTIKSSNFIQISSGKQWLDART